MLVALDSNLVDLFEAACASTAHVEAIEAMAPPPPFNDMATHQEAEVFACYWLLALAPAWTSTVYTFSDAVYAEISDAPAPRSHSLLRVALDVLVREQQGPHHRQPATSRRPADQTLRELGVKRKDAPHVADAIGMRCDFLLTNDRQLRNRSVDVEARWGLKIRRPSEYLTSAVRDGAPWAPFAPWPWESIQRIRARSGS